MSVVYSSTLTVHVKIKSIIDRNPLLFFVDPLFEQL